MGRRHFDDYEPDDWKEEHKRAERERRKRDAKRHRHDSEEKSESRAGRDSRRPPDLLHTLLLLLLEQALVRGDPLRSEQADDFWRNATDVEHQIAVTILEQSSNNVEAKLRDIKTMLGSS